MNIIPGEILQYNVVNDMRRNIERSINFPLLTSDVGLSSEPCVFQFYPLICQLLLKKSH